MRRARMECNDIALRMGNGTKVFCDTPYRNDFNVGVIK